MVNRKTASALTIAAILACAVPIKPAASRLVPVLAQATPSFPVPDSVPKGTKVRISSSSDNVNAISAALGEGFESQYSNSKVDVENKSADEAIADVLNDNADLAAISRPLTAEEKEKGLIAVPVSREKIAIVTDVSNPFSGSITGEQFARIFRGEIKDWGEIGGEAGPIKMLDRPESSETRQALKPYPVFTTAPFESGANTARLEADTTDALVKAIDKASISYVLVDQLEGQSKLKALELHKVLPSDPRYPFSQPYSFVYAGGATPAVSSFLGYATGEPGQGVINTAEGITGTGVLPNATAAGIAGGNAAAGDGSNAGADNVAESPSATANADSGDSGAATGGGTAANVDGDSTAGTDSVVSPTDGAVTLEGADDVGDGTTDGVAARGAGDLGRGRWWWLLLPLAGLALLIWAAGKRGSDEETGYIANADRDDTIRPGYGAMGTDTSIETGAGTGTANATINSPSSGASRPGLGKVVTGGAALTGGAAAAGAGLAGRMKNKAGDATMDLQEGISGTVEGGVNSVKGGVDGLKGRTSGSVDSSARGRVENLKGGFSDGADSIRGSASGSLGGLHGGAESLKGKVQGSIDGVKSNVQGGIDGIKGNVQGRVDGTSNQMQGGIDTARDAASGGVSGVRSNLQSGIDGMKGSAQKSSSNLRSNIQAGTDGVRGRVQGAADEIKGNDPDSWLERAKRRINKATEQMKDQASDLKDDITKE